MVAAERHPQVRVRVGHIHEVPADGHPEVAFLPQFSADACFGGFAGPNLAAGELPQAAEHRARAPLAEENPSPPPHDAGADLDVGDAAARPARGNLLLEAAGEREAQAPDRAGAAVGLARRADAAAEFHHRLVPIAGVPLGHERLGGAPEAGARRAGVRGLADGKPAGEDADGVGVKGRQSPTERNRQDRAAGVASDAGQARQRARIVGHAPAVVADDAPGGLVQVHRAAIVAEALPRF